MLNDIRKHPYFSAFVGVVLVVTLIALNSCAEFAAGRSAVAKHGADAADQVLESALWTICNGVSVGAIKRRFKTQDERAAYNVLCPEGEAP
jgi:hypothetical protein